MTTTSSSSVTFVNIVVDEALLQQASELLGELDHAKLIERALTEMIRHRKNTKSMFDLAGKVMLRGDYDYKALRAGDETTKK